MPSTLVLSSSFFSLAWFCSPRWQTEVGQRIASHRPGPWGAAPVTFLSRDGVEGGQCDAFQLGVWSEGLSVRVQFWERFCL